MGRRRAEQNPSVAAKLRSEGYVLLPPLWIKATDMPEIQKITDRHSTRVHQVRAEVRKIKENPALSDEAWNSR